MRQVLSLTADEVMLLTDRVLNQDEGTKEMPLSAYPLLLRLGSAYLDAFSEGVKHAGEISLGVAEPELWLLRSKVTSGDKSSTDSLLGVRLLCKIYRGLLAYNSSDVSESLPDGPPEEDIKLSDFSKKALGQWVERNKDV